MREMEIEEELALLAWLCESNLGSHSEIKACAKRIADLRQLNAIEVEGAIRKRVFHERQLRKSQERKEDEDRRFLFIILFFVAKMNRDRALEFAGHDDNYFLNRIPVDGCV